MKLWGGEEGGEREEGGGGGKGGDGGRGTGEGRGEVGRGEGRNVWGGQCPQRRRRGEILFIAP